MLSRGGVSAVALGTGNAACAQSGHQRRNRQPRNEFIILISPLFPFRLFSNIKCRWEGGLKIFKNKLTSRDTRIRIVAFEQDHLVVARFALVVPLRAGGADYVARVARRRAAHPVRRDKAALRVGGGVAEREGPVLDGAVDGAPDAERGFWFNGRVGVELKGNIIGNGTFGGGRLT